MYALIQKQFFASLAFMTAILFAPAMVILNGIGAYMVYDYVLYLIVEFACTL